MWWFALFLLSRSPGPALYRIRRLDSNPESRQKKRLQRHPLGCIFLSLLLLFVYLFIYLLHWHSLGCVFVRQCVCVCVFVCVCVCVFLWARERVSASLLVAKEPWPHTLLASVFFFSASECSSSSNLSINLRWFIDLPLAWQVGWHDVTVFRKDSFYNLCLPQRPKTI